MPICEKNPKKTEKNVFFAKKRKKRKTVSLRRAMDEAKGQGQTGQGGLVISVERIPSDSLRPTEREMTKKCPFLDFLFRRFYPCFLHGKYPAGKKKTGIFCADLRKNPVKTNIPLKKTLPVSLTYLRSSIFTSSPIERQL